MAPHSPDVPVMPPPPRDGVARPRLASVSPPQGSPPHALDVCPVGGMYHTPSRTQWDTTYATYSSVTAHTASTDSQGHSTIVTCSPGDIPFITTPGPVLQTLGLEPMALGYMPSAGPFLVAQRTPCATPHPQATRPVDSPVCMARDLYHSFGAAQAGEPGPSLPAHGPRFHSVLQGLESTDTYETGDRHPMVSCSREASSRPCRSLTSSVTTDSDLHTSSTGSACGTDRSPTVLPAATCQRRQMIGLLPVTHPYAVNLWAQTIELGAGPVPPPAPPHGGGGDSAGPRTPTTPPPPQGPSAKS